MTERQAEMQSKRDKRIGKGRKRGGKQGTQKEATSKGRERKGHREGRQQRGKAAER